jgi:hypothetical protein
LAVAAAAEENGVRYHHWLNLSEREREREKETCACMQLAPPN